jgi:hypothetical protein
MVTRIALSQAEQDEIRDAFRGHRVREEFWATRYEDYKVRYPDQFVAVKDGEVVAASKDLRDLVHLLDAKGIEPTQAWLEFIRTKPPNFIL